MDDAASPMGLSPDSPMPNDSMQCGYLWQSAIDPYLLGLPWGNYTDTTSHSPEQRTGDSMATPFLPISRKVQIGIIAFMCLGISASHFLTPVHHHPAHLIFDRLCYVPILVAAYWFGLWGGIITAVALVVSHLIHIQLQWGGQFFSDNFNQTLEVMMYMVIGGVTGVLSEKLHRTARRLDRSYQALKEKTQEVLTVEEHLRRTERVQALAELSAGIAHEIRTPLASIKGAAEILASPSITPEQRQEFTQILSTESKHLNRVVSDFLDFARPNQQKLMACNVREAIESILDLTDRQRMQHTIKLHKEIAEGMPTVLFDPAQLKQVFANLISNAIQAMPEGGDLRISGQWNGVDSIVCSVEDTGAGIPASAIDRIFDPFFTTKPNGTGLGLSIVHKIVTHHRGILEAANRPDGGARFTIRIPVERESNG